MNPYVGREEKEHLVRITALAIMLNDVINIYAKLKSTDKHFVTHLRKSCTWLKKAISLRESYLPDEAKRDLCRSVGNMRLMLLPSDKAKKEHEETLKLKSVFPFAMDDFNDLYDELIETTCKVCARADYEDCQARRVMAKYGVFPYNPEATSTCQFSYMDPAVPLTAKQEESALIAEQLPVPEQPEPAAEQTETVQDDLRTVHLGLINGQMLTLTMDDYMAQHLLAEIRRPQRPARGIVACRFGGKLLEVDMAEVATIQTDNLLDFTWNIQPVTMATKQPECQPLPPVSKNEITTGDTERFFLQCKCGSTYFLTLQADTKRARCRYCSAPVFADRQADRIYEQRLDAEAVLMTNTYFVQQPKEDRLPPVSPAVCSGRSGYADPCNPFT